MPHFHCPRVQPPGLVQAVTYHTKICFGLQLGRVDRKLYEYYSISPERSYTRIHVRQHRKRDSRMLSCKPVRWLEGGAELVQVATPWVESKHLLHSLHSKMCQEAPRRILCKTLRWAVRSRKRVPKKSEWVAFCRKSLQRLGTGLERGRACRLSVTFFWASMRKPSQLSWSKAGARLVVDSNASDLHRDVLILPMDHLELHRRLLWRDPGAMRHQTEATREASGPSARTVQRHFGIPRPLSPSRNFRPDRNPLAIPDTKEVFCV